MHEMSSEKTLLFKAILKTIYEKNMLEFFPWRQEKKKTDRCPEGEYNQNNDTARSIENENLTIIWKAQTKTQETRKGPWRSAGPFHRRKKPRLREVNLLAQEHPRQPIFLPIYPKTGSLPFKSAQSREGI